MPKAIWQIILRCFILPSRPKRLAPKYQSIWKSENHYTPTASPLIYYCNHLATKLNALANKNAQDTLSDSKKSDHYNIRACYLYTTPTVEAVIQSYQTIRKLIVLPLFPQTSAVTHGAAMDAVMKACKPLQTLPSLHLVNGYYDHPAYINAVAETIKRHWQEKSKSEHLVISWHGMPQNYFDKGDAYYCFCMKSSRLLAEALQISKEEYSVGFQSRFGYQKWLSPYTTDIMHSAAQRYRSIDIVSPGFAVDCLETLHELIYELPVDAGIDKDYPLHYIPALNDSPEALALYQSLLKGL